MKITSLIIVVFAILLSVFFISTFKVTEYNQAIKIQFGKPIGDPITKPGLHFKKPFIQQIRYFDKRLMEWDGDPNQIPTKDKKYIKIDATARWKITDALKFYQTVRAEEGAQARLDDVIDGATRNVVSNHMLVEVVRNTNHILEENLEKKQDGQSLEKISFGRDILTNEIFEAASQIVPQYGIELIDVKIKRINYEEGVQAEVFKRMISERKRIAEQSRSEGKGLKAEILGKMEKELKEIRSVAYRKTQEIQGKADAKATQIYANAYRRDSDFFRFLKTVESYDQAIKKDSTLFLSTDSDYLKYFKSIR